LRRSRKIPARGRRSICLTPIGVRRRHALISDTVFVAAQPHDSGARTVTDPAEF
jgi:hypothetical protein